ncbi:ribosomal protein S5 domain 2-type protein [Auriculariales sp. MPI-PUGE-AT-0066]|nr:ribosomal protein S5 domain 2-type protein [Auriculariales sp. MPI-PUGE-AT-0066]
MPPTTMAAAAAAAAATTATSTTDSGSNMDALIFQRLHPKAYLERFLGKGFRPDGRRTADWRDLSFNVGSISTAHGSALVRLGDTTVVAGVKAEIAEPDLDVPTRGFIVPNLDLPAICSPKFKPGAPSDEAQVLSSRLYDLLISCEVLPLDSLCIQPAKAVWCIYIDIMCVNYDGNVYDATVAAVIAALRNTRLPKATFNEETSTTMCSRTELVPLSLQRLPLTLTFGAFDSLHLLADPTSFEEPMLDATLTVAIDESGQMWSMQQEGLMQIGERNSQFVVQECVQAAQQRRAQIQIPT